VLLLIVNNCILIIDRLEELISESRINTTIHKAFSYEDTIKLLGENLYDAVLMDIDLPGNNLLSLLHEIKTSSLGTCVILFFSHIDSYSVEKYRSMGVDYFYDKHYDFEKICDLLRDMAEVKDIQIAGRRFRK